NQVHAQNVPGNVLGFIAGARQLHAPALAAAPSVNLRLDNHHVGLQALRRLARFFLGVSDLAPRRSHSVTRKNGLGLILVNIHRASISARICVSVKQRSLLGSGKSSKERRQMPASTMISLIAQLEAGQFLSRAAAEGLMEELLSGRMETADIVRLLSALNQRPILVEELTGFAAVMRRHATRIFADGETRPECLIDTCGTGGDNFGSFNISTAAAIVAA